MVSKTQILETLCSSFRCASLAHLLINSKTSSFEWSPEKERTLQQIQTTVRASIWGRSVTLASGLNGGSEGAFGSCYCRLSCGCQWKAYDALLTSVRAERPPASTSPLSIDSVNEEELLQFLFCFVCDFCLFLSPVFSIMGILTRYRSWFYNPSMPPSSWQWLGKATVMLCSAYIACTLHSWFYFNVLDPSM